MAVAALTVALPASTAWAATAPAPPARPVLFKWLGPMSCGSWPKTEAYNSGDKAIALNWALGFLSGRAATSRIDLLANVDQASVSAWFDLYCTNQPLDTIPVAIYVLEAELASRVGK
jgi:hypothetical protein